MKNIKSILIASVAIMLMFLASCAQRPGEKSCTWEAKICPDGSAVGRTGPDCEFEKCPTTDANNEINNFEDCAAAGYPVGESYPRQCFAPDKTFVEETGKISKTIDTGKGELKLAYDPGYGGRAILSGKLYRSTPCVNWEIMITSTKDMPTSQVNININSKNTAEVCIQVVGEPQEISEKIMSVSENTNYRISVNSKEVFSGKINSANSGTGIVEPETSEGISSLIDIPLESYPSSPVPSRFVIEHRSALDGRTIEIRTFVAGTLLGEQACPPDRGACAQPRIWLNEFTGADRDKEFDLMVLLDEDDNSTYKVYDNPLVKGIVHGSKSSVYVEKTK